MTAKHAVSWERGTTEYVDGNGWVITEPTGATFVSCSCGFQRTVAKQDTQRTIDEHQKAVGDAR